ncbi:F-box/WD repeat-containing protein 9-like [Xenia sp. Carnegie-2017]|uniref:F-box/WD repeat-containing protein 9-like n=1 Tax=Xenia sp. Carnegie-2017 TaxID=2897299 RepID=UPI001F0436B6|nr:F-box/WD repeat-containing protein 9-like [Xenia sp. Carnegie-2017]XP_046851964.1 F-box/WD repeat-containing protein 9-like [Xenia sp. Carnegie-2017]XP_046851972.1 F-box/WD repeat-containing protein 9-like [Xenia sp. Carnegie-2017]
MMNLTDLPPELLLSIFYFLRTRIVLTKVACVCKLFYHLVSTEAIWKIRFTKSWPTRIKTHNDFRHISPRWKELCYKNEEFDEFWVHEKKILSMTSVIQSYPIDSLLLMNSGRLLISGSRDRSICITNLENMKKYENEFDLSKAPCSYINEHMGWIWRLVHDPINPERFCSGAWDGYIKLWDVQTLTCSESIHTATPPLCISWTNDLLIAGCNDKTIRLIDPRTFSMVEKLKNHTSSVLCLYASDDVIISGSDDQTLCVFDKKAGKVLKKLQLASPAFCLHHWSYGYDLLRVAGRKNIYDISMDDRCYELIKTNGNTGHSKKINDFACFKGALLTGSADGKLLVCEPSLSLSPTKLLHEGIHEITRLSTCENILAMASSGGKLCLWRF